MAFNWNNIFGAPTDLEKKVSELEKVVKLNEATIANLKSCLEVARRDVLEKTEDMMDLKSEINKLEKIIKKSQKGDDGLMFVVFLLLFIITVMGAIMSR